MKSLLAICLSVCVTPVVFAEVTVSDVQVFSGYPWQEVVVGYTIAGTDTDTEADADVVQLTAADKSANKTYVAQSLTGAVLTEGRHVLRWNAASEGAKFSSSNVVFSVSIVRLGVRLWADGPYWAECNVGATKPEEYGYYFWWGDTVGYKRNARNNDWVSVKDGASFSFSYENCSTHDKKDSWLQSAGYIDATGNLVAAHDAATAHLGALWRMPTQEEFVSLITNCTSTWTTRNGVYGRLVTGKGAYSSKSIFLSAAGDGSDSYLRHLASNGYDSEGCYWSSTSSYRYTGDSSEAAAVIIRSNNFMRSNRDRYDGYTVRPVRMLVK